MFLSIIIPVYNAGPFLAECLDSCIDQDIPSDDYEIICVNDGSTDNSYSILTEYSANYPHIHIINQDNKGVSIARNAGMEVASGEYLWFVDADDFIQTNILSELQKITLETNCDCLSFGLYYFNNQLSKDEAAKKELGQLNCSIVGGAQPASLLKRDCLSAIRWEPGIEVGEDAIFMSQFKMVANKYAEIKKTVYYYRQQPNSVLHKCHDFKKRLHSHVNGSIIMNRIFHSEGGQNELNANNLLTFVVYSTVMIAQKYSESQAELKRLKECGLFPFTTPSECTKTNAYTTSRKDVWGRLYNRLCMKSVTKSGMLLLRMYYRLHLLMK